MSSEVKKYLVTVRTRDPTTAGGARKQEAGIRAGHSPWVSEEIIVPVIKNEKQVSIRIRAWVNRHRPGDEAILFKEIKESDDQK